MERQLRLRSERLARGEKSIGWKVGLGAPAALQRLHIQAPLIGFLTDRVLLDSGVTVSTNGWSKPAAEPEVAIYLGKDLAGEVDRQSVQNAIIAVGPAIELADVHFPPDDVEMILADNIYNRHVLLGKADSSRAGGVVDGLVGRISCNGEELPLVTDPQGLTGDIIQILSHTANLLHRFGEQPRAGDVIIAGSIIPPLWVEGNMVMEYTLAPIGTIWLSLETIAS
jgi:2-keto-4-pentenoate hydratase